MAFDTDLDMKSRNAECRRENPGKSMVKCARIISQEEMGSVPFKPKAVAKSSAYKAAEPTFLDRLLNGFRESLEKGTVRPNSGSRNIVPF